MRRRYNTRSAGGSTTPYTPYTPGEMPPAPTVALTLTGPDTVTRGDSATYTARITPAGLSLDTTLTFEWKYTTTVRDDRDAVSITERIDATSENPQSAAWSGTMVSGGTLEVRTTVNGTKLVQTMDVKVNKRAWVTDVPICTDTTSLGAEAPRSHTDLGDVEYDILFSPAHDLETATVSSGPNKGILYTTAINLNAPLIVKINRHFRMAVADLPPTWVAFKNANTLYGEIEAKVKARLGFDGTTNGTLYGDWVSEINDNNPEANIEEFMEVPNRLRSDYEDQIVDRVEGLRTSRKAGMATRISEWSPSGITINYNYFAAYAGEDQAVDVNTTATFDGSSSGVSAGRTIKKYSWNFGLDADPATGSGDKPRCTYSTPGEKTVTLTVTDSADDTDSDTMTVIVRDPSERHDGIPFGMMGIQYQTSSVLRRNFHTIYEGDSNFSHSACNHLHSYGYDFDNDNRWGLTDSDFPIVDAAGNPDIEANRPMRNAKAWANFVKTVSFANNGLGGSKLKCLISNRLMWMRLVQGWSLEEISRYVRHTIEKIDDIRPTSTNPNPKDIVAGWYLSDDGLSPRKTNYTVANLSAVVHAVHSAQKACCVNWPFYFADNIDDRPFWNEAATQFTIPQKLKDWVRAFPPDATPIFMPYYYPWLSDNWNDAMNPPWGKWKMYIEELNKAFFNPDGTAKIHKNLKFHPILDASEKMAYRSSPTPQDPDRKIRDTANLPLPGHADMHKQIRVVWNLLQKYPSVTGIWFLGWNIDDGKALQRATAHNNWTENRKWAEAVQNEPHATEGICEAIPDVSKIHLPFKTSDPNAPGTRIPYSLSERKRFEIRIYDDNIDDNPNAKLVRTLDEGYDGVSPQGEFVNSNWSGHTYKHLGGTSAYWDLNADGGAPVGPGLYYVYLYLGATKVEGHQTIRIPRRPTE